MSDLFHSELFFLSHGTFVDFRLKKKRPEIWVAVRMNFDSRDVKCDCCFENKVGDVKRWCSYKSRQPQLPDSDGLRGLK